MNRLYLSKHNYTFLKHLFIFLFLPKSKSFKGALIIYFYVNIYIFYKVFIYIVHIQNHLSTYFDQKNVLINY